MAATPPSAPGDIPAHHLERQRPAPIAASDSEACHGHYRINRQPLGLCINCGRFSNGTPPTMEPAAALGADGWDCPNRRSLGALIDAETVDAVDETAGLHGACTVRSKADAGQSAERGGEVANSTRAGEGG